MAKIISVLYLIVIMSIFLIAALIVFMPPDAREFSPENTLSQATILAQPIVIIVMGIILLLSIIYYKDVMRFFKSSTISGYVFQLFIFFSMITTMLLLEVPYVISLIDSFFIKSERMIDVTVVGKRDKKQSLAFYHGEPIIILSQGDRYLLYIHSKKQYEKIKPDQKIKIRVKTGIWGIDHIQKEDSIEDIDRSLLRFPLEKVEKVKDISMVDLHLIMKRRTNTLVGYCYEKALLEKPTVKGRFKIEWQVNSRQRATDIKITEKGFVDSAFDKCLIDQVKKIQFPAENIGMNGQYQWHFVPN